MKVITPSVYVPLLDANGRVTGEWSKFFSQLTALPSNMVAQSPVGSPFSYTAPDWGNLLVQGGTVSSISLTRGTNTVTTGIVGGFIPLAKGDTVTVTYSVAPNITWLPS